MASHEGRGFAQPAAEVGRASDDDCAELLDRAGVVDGSEGDVEAGLFQRLGDALRDPLRRAVPGCVGNEDLHGGSPV